MFSSDQFVIILLFVIAVALNLIAEVIRKQALGYYSKILLMPLLLSYYWLINPIVNQFIMLALLSAFVGDAFILFKEKRTFFILGILSFLACHIFYIIYFAGLDFYPSEIPWYFWFVIAVYLVAGLIIFMKLNVHLGGMKVPVIIYTLAILTMSFFCSARFPHYSGMAYWFPVAGSVLFIASDAILAFNSFRKPIKRAGLYIMITYIAAQVLIILGIMTE